MTVEHHQFLPQLRRWIKSGEVKTPFNVLNIDAHHDYYRTFYLYPSGKLTDPTRSKLNCGNWGYHLPTSWYNRFTWVHNQQKESDDWDKAQKWLTDKNIKSSVRTRHRLSRLRGEIVAATFCVSPDFVNVETMPHIPEIVDIVANHFNMEKVPTRVKHGLTSPYVVKGWRTCLREKVKCT